MSATSQTGSKTKPKRVVPEKKRKLGKGLGALLGEVRKEEPLATKGSSKAAQSGNSGSLSAENSSGAGHSGTLALPIAAIQPLPGQPRKHFDEAALEELAASIAARGVIQPIIVTDLGKGKYQLVAGERRWRAAQKARLHEIPALVRDLDEREIMALALIENIQREDLSPVEEAYAYQALVKQESLTQAELAGMVDKSRSHVANLMRLLALPEPVLELVSEGALSMGHARALIGQDDAAEMADQIVAKNMSVRDVEKMIRGPKQKSKRKAPISSNPSDDADILAVQNHLEEFLGLAARIRSDAADPRSGSVTIHYRTLDQLDLICQRLTGGGI